MQQRLPKRYEQYPYLTNYSPSDKNSFTDVFPLFMRSRGYALCCDFQGIHGFIARKWNVALFSGTSSYALQENSFFLLWARLHWYVRQSAPYITFSVRTSKFIPLFFFFCLSSKCRAKSRKYHIYGVPAKLLGVTYSLANCSVRCRVLASNLFGALPRTTRSFQCLSCTATNCMPHAVWFILYTGRRTG